MVSRISFYATLVFICSCFFCSSIGYAQKSQALVEKTLEIDSVRFEPGHGGMLTKELIEKLSKEQLYDLIEAQIDKEDDLLETELDYYNESGIPRFLTPPVALWSSIVAFLTILAIVTMPIFFRHKKNLLLFDTINSMVAKEVAIPPQLLLSIQTTTKKRSRLTIGIILSAIGLGVVLFFVFISDPDEGIWSIGLIPLLLGVGYLILWRLEEKQQLPG